LHLHLIESRRLPLGCYTAGSNNSSPGTPNLVKSASRKAAHARVLHITSRRSYATILAASKSGGELTISGIIVGSSSVMRKKAGGDLIAGSVLNA
jgi:hypothetical protein